LPFIIYHFSFVIYQHLNCLVVNDKWKMINDKWKMKRAASDEGFDSPCLDPLERLIDTVIALIDLPGRQLLYLVAASGHGHTL